MQYLGYCTGCNSFNISHGLNPMLKILTRYLSKLAIRVPIYFVFSFQFTQMILEKLSSLLFFSHFHQGFFSLYLPLPDAPLNPNCTSSTAIAPPRQFWQERAWSVGLPWNAQITFPTTAHTILWNPHYALKSSKSSIWCQSTACCLSPLKSDCSWSGSWARYSGYSSQLFP